jgi:transcriptional regulator with XRE-family HTH domain
MVCERAGISRGRLSEIERGHVRAKADELNRIEDALRQLIEARSKVAEVAAECGWPMTVA